MPCQSLQFVGDVSILVVEKEARGVQLLINSNISFNLSPMDCVNSSLRVEQEDRRQCLACFSNSFVGGHQQQQRIDC